MYFFSIVFFFFFLLYFFFFLLDLLFFTSHGLRTCVFGIYRQPTSYSPILSLALNKPDTTPICLRLASLSISIISVANSRALKRASFWRPWNSTNTYDHQTCHYTYSKTSKITSISLKNLKQNLPVKFDKKWIKINLWHGNTSAFSPKWMSSFLSFYLTGKIHSSYPTLF